MLPPMREQSFVMNITFSYEAKIWYNILQKPVRGQVLLLITEIRIKRDGKWYANDAEMFRIPIVNLFARHLERDENGQFYIHLNDEIFPVVVEDTPFTATKARVENGCIVFTFHDGQEMVIDEEIPLVYKGDTPYLTFKWENDTRINRSAYWMIADYLVERGDQVFLVPPRVMKGTNNNENYH